MSRDKDFIRQLYRASTVGIHLVAATFIGFGIGYMLDNWLGTRPWMMLVFFILGLFTGFRDLFRMVNDTGDLKHLMKDGKDGTDKEG